MQVLEISHAAVLRMTVDNTNMGGTALLATFQLQPE